MAEPQYDPNGLGNGAPDSSEANGSLPERFQGMTAEQIAAAYEQYEQETTRRMQELEPARQAYEELQPYGGYDALKAAYAQTYNEYQNLLNQVGGQQVNPQQYQNGHQPQQPSEDWTQDWDYRTPQQQAQIIAQQVLQQMNQQAESYYSRALQQLQEQNKQEHERQRREFDVYRSVLDRQRQNPDLDATQLLQEAVSISNSPPERLMDVAARMLADKTGKSQAEIERLAQERFEQMKADWEQEQQNRELSSLNDGGDAFPFGQFRDPETGAVPSRQETERRVMEKLLSDPNSGFTKAHFS